MVFSPNVRATEGPLLKLPFATVFTTLYEAPPSGKEVIFIVNDWAPRLDSPSEDNAAVRTWVHVALGPEAKLPQSSIDDEEETTDSGAKQSESTPFKLSALNSTSPLENWNLTALSKLTPVTVTVFSPKTKSAPALEGPKCVPPFCVVLKILYFAPPSGKDVTFIVKVWDPRLASPSAVVVATRIWAQLLLVPATKLLQSAILILDGDTDP